MVKSVLHTSHVPPQPQGQPLSRDEQAKALSDTLMGSIAAEEGCSLYVSGLPGTGG
jgi:hypothetical protein